MTTIRPTQDQVYAAVIWWATAEDLPIPAATARAIRAHGWPLRLLTADERAIHAARVSHMIADSGPVVACIDCQDGRSFLHANVMRYLDPARRGA